MRLYIFNSTSLEDPRDHEEWDSCLPAGRWEKAARLASLQDRKNAAGAGWLLREVFRREGISFQSDAFYYKKHGKPYHPALHFNLSHSGIYVICATGQTEIGCDIQQDCPCRERMVRRFFSPAEQEYIFSGEGEERDVRFIRIWTRKESYVKKTGDGLTMDLRQISCLSGIGFFEYGLPGYHISICNEELCSEPEVNQNMVEVVPVEHIDMVL